VRTQYVLIDYENVQPQNLTGLEAEHFRVLLMVGANQGKVSLELAAAMQRLGHRAEYVKMSGQGPNALDFHIAYYIGHLSAQDKTALFHIISADKGFDPLIQHLRSRRIMAVRSRRIEEIPALKARHCQSIPEKVDVVVANLKQQGVSKPRTLQTLTRSVSALFQKQISEEELSAVISQLQTQGVVVVNESKVSYALPQSSA